MQNTGTQSMSEAAVASSQDDRTPQITQDFAFAGTAIYAWFVRIFKRLNDDQTRFVQNYGVTPSQYGVMAVLMQEDDLTFTELGRRTVLHGSTLTGIIDRLERKGMVVRSNDVRDRRQIQLRLTEEGRSLFCAIPTFNEYGLLGSILKSFSDEERQELLRWLIRVGEEMGEDNYNRLIACVHNSRHGANRS